LTFYFIELCWCIWLVSWIIGELVENPAWFNWVGLIIAFGLLVWWVHTINQVLRPKKIDFVVEQDVLENWWVTRDGLIKSGPYTYRHQAFEWMIQQTQKEIRRNNGNV
jgi:hypothetical protein